MGRRAEGGAFSVIALRSNLFGLILMEHSSSDVRNGADDRFTGRMCDRI